MVREEYDLNLQNFLLADLRISIILNNYQLSYCQLSIIFITFATAKKGPVAQLDRATAF